jgi:hypothetical protein
MLHTSLKMFNNAVEIKVVKAPASSYTNYSYCSWLTSPSFVISKELHWWFVVALHWLHMCVQAKWQEVKI